jgi:hypothetical protein
MIAIFRASIRCESLNEFTAPLCRRNHREVHRCGDEAAWWLKTTIDQTAAARLLWLEYIRYR